MKLTDRQLIEKHHYDILYGKHRDLFLEEVDIDVVYESEKKPYNPYWKIYDLLRQNDLSAKRVLDCGCGAGEHSIRLAALGLEVHGIDISETAIEVARERVRKQGYEKKAVFSVAPLEHLPYEDEYFNFVFGIDVLHHVNIQEAIPEIRRILKTAGKAFFKEWKEYPLFDRIRNSSLGLRLVPKTIKDTQDVVHDCTPTEKKLNKAELVSMSNQFSRCELFYYYVFARLSRLSNNGKLKETLLKTDYRLTRFFPVLKRLSGEVIIVLRK